MFDDEDGYFDDFEESMASKQEQEFNANELLNLQNYQNKRKQTETAKAQPNLNIKDVFNGKAA